MNPLGGNPACPARCRAQSSTYVSGQSYPNSTVENPPPERHQMQPDGARPPPGNEPAHHHIRHEGEMHARGEIGEQPVDHASRIGAPLPSGQCMNRTCDSNPDMLASALSKIGISVNPSER